MAAVLPSASDASTPTGLVALLVSRPHPDLCTEKGSFRSYRGHKGKWESAAKQVGLSKADGERLNIAAGDRYATCCAAWTALLQAARSEEHTSELQSLMRISYAVFCLKKKNTTQEST